MVDNENKAKCNNVNNPSLKDCNYQMNANE